MGKSVIARVYDHADVLHCEPIAAVADEITTMCAIPKGSRELSAGEEAPSYWAIGNVFSRLIEDAQGEAGAIETLLEVYGSFMAGAIENYRSDLFYQSREYIAQCYKAGEILDE